MYILALIRKYWKSSVQTILLKPLAMFIFKQRKRRRNLQKLIIFYTAVPHVAYGLYPLPKRPKTVFKLKKATLKMH